MGSLEEKFIEVCEEHLSRSGGYEIRGEQGIFSPAMVVWLGIQQRLGGQSLRSSLNDLVERTKQPGIEFLVSRMNHKLRTSAVSNNTGGISRARERVSVEEVEDLLRAATESIFASASIRKTDSNVYVLDGQVLTIARSDSNLEYFSPTGNGMGELHFPRMRAISAHEVSSGVAREVAVGSWKESEVALSRNVAKRLPQGALLVMDRGFAKPRFLDAVIAEGVDVLVRLKDSHGSKLLKGAQGSLVDQETIWIAKLKDKDGAEKTVLNGRVIRYVSHAKGFRSSEFHFFTTDKHRSAQEIAELYLKRVQVEVFIRDVKQTLRMAFVRSKKGETVAKEILIAFLTFNLIRAIMADTADALGLPVQRMSFTGTISLIRAYASSFTTARTDADRQLLLKQFRTNMNQSKLPNRSKPRSYPRVIKLVREKYPAKAIVENDAVKEEIGK